MSHYYSKVDADSLLSLVNASDCVEYFDTSSLVSEMDETEVLNQISEDTISKTKGLKSKRRIEYEIRSICFIYTGDYMFYRYALRGYHYIQPYENILYHYNEYNLYRLYCPCRLGL